MVTRKQIDMLPKKYVVVDVMIKYIYTKTNVINLFSNFIKPNDL